MKKKLMLSENIDSYETGISERGNANGKSLDALRSSGSIFCMVMLHEELLMNVRMSKEDFFNLEEPLRSHIKTMPEFFQG